MSDLITRYLALPPGLKLAEAAERLGCGRTTLIKHRYDAGLAKPVIIEEDAPARDAEIMAQYLALRLGVCAAAKEMGVTRDRLRAAIRRTTKSNRKTAADVDALRRDLGQAVVARRVARDTLWKPVEAPLPPLREVWAICAPGEAPTPSRPVDRGATGGMPLPAGHPETWDVLGFGPWPGARA